MSIDRFIAIARPALWLFGLFFLLASLPALAEDLFDGKAPKDIARFVSVPAGSTVGGYPLYPGDDQWHYVSAEASRPNNVGVVFGSAHLIHPDGGNYFAEMIVTVNLNQGGAVYYTSDPCSGEHLFKFSRAGAMGGEGSSDDCLTVNPQVVTISGKAITTLTIRIRNTQSAGRMYDMQLLLNAAGLGAGETTAADWSKDALARHADRSKLLDKVTAWARKLQDAVKLAIAFSKPRDAFKNVPSFRELRLS
jgi:hypothetical protein